MKLLYITNARIPTEKAHGIQIMKMCEAFQQAGLFVELLVPFRVQSSRMKEVKKTLWDYYDVDTPFHIRHIPALDFIPLEAILPQKIVLGLYYIQSLLFSLFALFFTWRERDAFYYSRDLQTLFLLCLTKHLHRKAIFYEAHELHGIGEATGVFSSLSHRIMSVILDRVDGMIAITKQLQAGYNKRGIDEGDILVAPDGISAKRLSVSPDKAAARQRLQIPLDRKIVCYTGHLFRWKGVYTLADSAAYLPENWEIYIVGGMESDVAALQRYLGESGVRNVVITGYMPYNAVSSYLSAADVLVLPNSQKARISREYTSPLKLFEYMAAQRPIVASNLPSIREVLCHQQNAWLVNPDDPQALADGMITVMNNVQKAEHLVNNAFQDVRAYTWERRAQQICEFFARRMK
ncbi:hypothetical protein CSA56_07425 [candidate division KSB3 bacterium]|uniref:Glycosyltransferase subfamily 4-like N-terminal domain-containing protein n=1 Tax=candidate division KSB3 bacterium TaxID=2044937 RepID=A0A2G6KHQ6_9BACT|nr:MAG: hypothetical protein CSA56_07425 [candidate division KSB3 bacterium]